VERFQRHDPTSGQSVGIVLSGPFVAGNRWDDYQEVSLRFADGRHYLTSFWRDPQERGRHWIEEPGMVIVHDLTQELVLAAVEDILAHGSVEAAFEAVRAGG
jgi:hypothetical protein